MLVQLQPVQSSDGITLRPPRWPAERPQFVIDQGVQGEQGEPPRSSEPVYLLGESWRTFSFSFSWSGQDPVRVIQLWMTRFVAEQS